MKNKNLLILSGVAFSVYAVYEIVRLIVLFASHGRFFPIIEAIICLCGCALCAFSFFKSNSKLLMLGLFGILGIVYRVENIIYYIANYHYIGAVVFYILSNLIIIFCIVTLGLYCLSRLNSSSDQSTRQSGSESDVDPNLVSEDLTTKLERLEKLQRLKDIDAITSEELEAAKKQILR